ncbi:MAG: hypothetical protein IJY24_05045 [Clostridia bacterium]|nr:hypothetical protein [Clostridia bacterium]
MENLFSNIGKKIMALAKILCWVGIACSVIAWVSGLIASADSYEPGITILLAFVVLVVGFLISWIGSWTMYAFGQVIDDNQNMRAEIVDIKKENITMRDQLAVLNENLSELSKSIFALAGSNGGLCTQSDAVGEKKPHAEPVVSPMPEKKQSSPDEAQTTVSSTGESPITTEQDALQGLAGRFSVTNRGTIVCEKCQFEQPKHRKSKSCWRCGFSFIE